MKKVLTTMILISFFLVFVSSALGASQYVPAFAGQQQKLADGVAYLDGGVGINERAQMQQMDSAYNLKIVFDVNSGNYLANVGIKIAKKGNTLVDTVSSGPWFYVKLPAGTYEVTGTFDGHQVTRTVTVGAKTHAVIMTWKI